MVMHIGLKFGSPISYNSKDIDVQTYNSSLAVEIYQETLALLCVDF